MSEREFEWFLAVLGRMLRLNEAQRAAIADECRDHMESRFAELTASGVPRDEAARQVLEEFGDVAGLAAQFAQLAEQRKRRWVMRCTLASCVGLTVIALGAMAFWPADRGPAGPAFLAAQNKPERKAEALQLSQAEQDVLVERKLSQPMTAVELVDAPFVDTIEYIRQNAEVDILVDRRVTEELGIALDTPVTLDIKFARPSARTVLETILRQIHPDISYVVRDGLVWITTNSASLTTKVYDCRDLIGSHGATPKTGQTTSEVAADLQAVIITTIRPESWQQAGGMYGTICGFGGLYVIKQSGEAHREIDALLAMLREATAENSPDRDDQPAQ